MKRDKQATMDKQYLDSRSYVGNWLHPDTDHACEYLFGEDKTARRKDIAMQAAYLCQGCRTPHFIGWDDGEWDHIKGGRGRQHCDCKENGRWVCFTFHRKRHVHVKSDRAAHREAQKEAT